MYPIALGLLLSANAITRNKMKQKCPSIEEYHGETGNGYSVWDDVDSAEWDFEDDWEDRIEDGEVVYPAGFRNYTLGQFNEPPVCIFVDDSRNKKIEVLIESPMENTNLCITDADYDGISNNDVGNVKNCGTGKIYACFTAAEVQGTDDNPENFGFIVNCEEGCEDMDITLWIRVRLSKQNWDAGKTSTKDDLEHWCEGERGSTFTINNVEQPGKMFYTYPSDLVPDEPSVYPFHIQHIFGRNAGSQTKPNIWLVSVVAVVGLACLFGVAM